VDLTEVRLTADVTNLHFCVKLADITTVTGNGAPLVQVAIDLDRVAGSGGSDLGLLSDAQDRWSSRGRRLVPGAHRVRVDVEGTRLTSRVVTLRQLWHSTGRGPVAIAARGPVRVRRGSCT
jgi:hypothetical protein